MKIQPNLDAKMSELYSSHPEIVVNYKVLLPKRSIAMEMTKIADER